MFKRLFSFFLILFFAVGCARLAPGPVPLVGDERALVLSRYQEYLQHLPSCSGIEADVGLQYQSILNDVRIPGVLLAAPPANLKVMGLGPLGQPQLLLSLHDGRFTLIDVQGQKGFTGSIKASRVEEMLPLENLVKIGLYGLLTGAPAVPLGDHVVVSHADEEEGSYSLTWPAEVNGPQVVFNPTRSRVEAFRLLDAKRRILLEIRYSPEREKRCGVPEAINISGSKVRGTVACSFEKVFPADSLPAGEFALAVPKDFTVEEVH